MATSVNREAITAFTLEVLARQEVLILEKDTTLQTFYITTAPCKLLQSILMYTLSNGLKYQPYSC